MENLRSVDVSPDDLLFDPNNYRFQDLDDHVPAAESRFHEESVQSKAEMRLRREDGMGALKASVLRNGYVPAERIVVRPYEHADGKYVVIEGNRRLAVVKMIWAEYRAGRDVESKIRSSIEKLPVLIAEEDGPDEIFRASLMGIRHVSGIKEWGGYQRAKLVVNMRDALHLDAPEVAERLGMTTHEVNRRYRAFKALQQMMDDEEFSDHAQPSMYPLFHEAVSLPAVRDEWLSWDDAASTFENVENLKLFYELLTPTASDEEETETKEPKLSSYSQVRLLKKILPKPEAKRSLLDLEKPFQEALALAEQEELSRLWATEVEAAIRALKGMSIDELKKLSAEQLNRLRALESMVQERLRDHHSLAGG